MNVEQLREQLKIDEGCVYEIYNDHLGYPTFGIGHLVRESDPENASPVGTKKSAKIESMKLSMLISKSFCQTATPFTQTLRICRRSSTNNRKYDV